MDANIEQLLHLYPAPWKIVDSNSGDHKNNPIPMLCDVALGNTDTSTEPYADPESEGLVALVNAFSEDI